MLAAPLALLAAPALAAQAVTTAELGSLTGADRMQRLIAGAKKEAVVDVYSSATADVMGDVTKGFEAKYGVKVRIWKAGTVAIQQRALTEARGGRFAVDVIETPASEMEALHREHLLQEVKLPLLADLMPGATAPGRSWIASRVIVFSGAYNTRLVKPNEVPKRYEDLLNPRWKGKIGVEATDAIWFMSLVQNMGEEKGLKLFRDIAATNGLSARQGHTTLGNMVVSGEVQIGLNVYRHFAQPAKEASAPIGELLLPPVLAVPSGAGVARRAPHPHAAVLFLDYILSEGQPRITGRDGALPTNLKYQRLPKDLKIDFVDVSRYVTENEKWRNLFRETLANQRR
jgi:iron(III) transport system substrate-binding protein